MDDADLIMELEKRLRASLKMVETYKTMITNYEVIVKGYQTMMKDEDDKKLSAIKMMEVDLKNTEALKNAFLIATKQNLQLRRELKEVRNNNKYDSIVRSN